MEQIFNLHVNFQKKGTDSPLTGNDYSVRFFDKDLVEDDFLGTSLLDEEGHATIYLTQSKFRSKDSPLEQYPDIYFKVYRNGEEIFKSPVVVNIQLKKVSEFDMSTGTHFNLGTFLI